MQKVGATPAVRRGILSGALVVGIINNVLGAIFLILLTYKVYSEEDWWFMWIPEMHLSIFIIVVFYIANTLNGPDPHWRALVGVL